MKALLIGGTGRISMSVTKELVAQGWQVYVLNRGDKNHMLPENTTPIVANVNDEPTVVRLLANLSFDIVVDFIAYTPSDLQRDYRIFKGRTKQFIFISTASAYTPTPSGYLINESTPLYNPYWKYSRDKADCEKYLNDLYEIRDFPVTIVRPSHTYDDFVLPVGVHGSKGSWSIAQRMLEGKTVIIHGDGTSLWTVTHSTDFAKGLVGIMGDSRAIGETFHITSDEVYSWNEIYQMIADALGVELKAIHITSDFLVRVSNGEQMGKMLGDKTNSKIFNNQKIKSLVPYFRATVPLRQGIKSTVDNLLAHPEYCKPDPEFDAWCDKVISAYRGALDLFKS